MATYNEVRIDIIQAITGVWRGRSLFTSQKQKAMGHLTDSQYKIIADRMIEEHRKYGDRLRPGHWADVAARKVASHMADFREGERVFAESEVMAIAEGIKLAVVELGGYYDANAKWCPLHGVRMGSIDQVFKAHGIVLDPD